MAARPGSGFLFLMVAAPIFEAMDRAQIALLSVPGGMSPFQTDRGALG